MTWLGKSDVLQNVDKWQHMPRFGHNQVKLFGKQNSYKQLCSSALTICPKFPIAVWDSFPNSKSASPDFFFHELCCLFLSVQVLFSIKVTDMQYDFQSLERNNKFCGKCANFIQHFHKYVCENVCPSKFYFKKGFHQIVVGVSRDRYYKVHTILCRNSNPIQKGPLQSFEQGDFFST